MENYFGLRFSNGPMRVSFSGRADGHFVVTQNGQFAIRIEMVLPDVGETLEQETRGLGILTAYNNESYTFTSLQINQYNHPEDGYRRYLITVINLRLNWFEPHDADDDDDDDYDDDDLFSDAGTDTTVPLDEVEEDTDCPSDYVDESDGTEDPFFLNILHHSIIINSKLMFRPSVFLLFNKGQIWQKQLFCGFLH